jgi:hypothetical protein
MSKKRGEVNCKKYGTMFFTEVAFLNLDGCFSEAEDALGLCFVLLKIIAILRG